MQYSIVSSFPSLYLTHSLQQSKMAEESNGNGVYVEDEEGEEVKDAKLMYRKGRVTQTLPEVLNRLASAILFPEPSDGGSFLRRIKKSVSDNAPLLPEASRNSARDLLLWTRRGSPLRALLVISVRKLIQVDDKSVPFLFVDSIEFSHRFKNLLAFIDHDMILGPSD